MTWSRLAIATLLLATTALAYAGNETIVVSTNNTPLDRKVLQAVSEEAFARAGAQFKLVSLPSERSLLSADNGDVDGEGLRVGGLSKDYPNLVQVPEPYVRISFVAFSTDATIVLDDWDSLRPYRVAFINGWKMFENNAASAKVVNKVDTPEQLFEMLQLGRVDLALYTRADGEVLTRTLGMSRIAPLTPALKDVDLYLYLHKKHRALVPEIAAAIRSMKTDGSYNAILASTLQP